MAEIELDKLILHYAQANKAEGKLPKTISQYTEMLNVFYRYLKSSDITPILVNFIMENVRAFIVYEQNRGLSPYTIQAIVALQNTFLIPD